MKRPMTLSTILFTIFLTRLFARLLSFFTAITPLPGITAVGSDNDGHILQQELRKFNATINGFGHRGDFARRGVLTLENFCAADFLCGKVGSHGIDGANQIIRRKDDLHTSKPCADRNFFES